jgi:fatty-acyl-CoA synthase
MPQPQDIIAVSERMSHIDPDDITNIQFTSGTTGKPKGACLSHFNILNNSYFIGQRLNYTNEDRVCISVPLYHCFGMVIGNLACINYGSAMVELIKILEKDLSQ